MRNIFLPEYNFVNDTANYGLATHSLWLHFGSSGSKGGEGNAGGVLMEDGECSKGRMNDSPSIQVARLGEVDGTGDAVLPSWARAVAPVAEELRPSHRHASKLAGK